MNITKLDNGNAEIGLQPCDVESAIRHFICACHPEFSIGYSVNPVSGEEQRLNAVSFVAEYKIPNIVIARTGEPIPKLQE